MARIKAFIATVDDLRGRCRLVPVPKPWTWARGEAQQCWLWQGSVIDSANWPIPKVHAFDYAAGRKRSMTGTRRLGRSLAALRRSQMP